MRQTYSRIASFCGWLSIAALPLLCCLAATAAQAQESLDRFPVERIQEGRTWRDGRALPAGDHIIDLGEAAEGSVLRLGILPGKDSEPGVAFEVHAGARRLWSDTTSGRRRWHEYSVPITPPTAEGTAIELRLKSGRPFALGRCAVVPPAPDRPNVIVYLIDTLRLDHMGCYGYERKTTPEIDAFARDAVRFSQLMPQSSWTKPSVAALLTGTYPERNGARDTSDVMRKGMPSLAKAFEEAGYETLALVANDYVLPKWGFGGDFQHFEFIHSTLQDEAVVDRAIQLMPGTRGTPSFWYIHVMGPHSPYWPKRPEFAARFQDPDHAVDEKEMERMLGVCRWTQTVHDARKLLGMVDKVNPDPTSLVPLETFMTPARLQEICIDLYDGDIASSDFEFGRLLDGLKREGRYDNTLILLLSDHGEELWDHGSVYHGHTLYEELLRVPLIVKLPDGRLAGERRDGIVNMVDIAPTLHELINLRQHDDYDGGSFRSLLDAGNDPGHIGYSSLLSIFFKRNHRIAKQGSTKYIFDVGNAQEGWFDLAGDPKETTPLATRPPEVEALRAHASRIAALGAHGLHLLLTGSIEKGDVLEGVLEAKGLGAVEIIFPEQSYRLQEKEDKAVFRLDMAEVEGRAVFQQSYQALIVAELPGSAVFRLTLFVNGEAIGMERVFTGPQRENHPLENTRFVAGNLTAPQGFLERVTLPRKAAAYLWYVPPAKVLDMSELDDSERESLKALGYLE